MLAIFIPGLNDKLLLSAAFLAALDAFLLLEIGRHSIPELNQFFSRFIDERDSNGVIATHIYLLIGIGFPVLVSIITEDSGLSIAGIVSLGIGDSFASLIGYYFGKIKIPHRKKTVEGTLACWISMIAATWVILHEFSPSHCVKLAMVAMYEAYTLHIDNLVLPVFTAGVFSLLSDLL